MTDETTDDGFEWAMVEIFGHRSHAGKAMEVERFGSKMLRIDVPKIEWQGEPAEAIVTAWVSHFYGGSSVFSYTPTDEEAVMRSNRPYRPVHRYIAPPEDVEEAPEDAPEDAEIDFDNLPF